MYREVYGRWGKCKFLEKDTYVGRSMFSYGEYNPDETEMIISLAAGRCLDVGANIGVISQALIASGFSVEAFEPQPEIFKLLVENCASMSLLESGHYEHNVAIGAQAGVANMPKVHYSVKNNFGGLGIGTPSIYGNIEVPVVTIDSFEYRDVGFIKVDVEGYELEVLEGAQETIKRCKPVMYLEDDRDNKSAALRKYLDYLGYSIEDHTPTLYRENNFFGLKKNVWDKNYASYNIICRPR